MLILLCLDQQKKKYFYFLNLSIFRNEIKSLDLFGATTECRATSDHLFYMCQNLFKNEA